MREKRFLKLYESALQRYTRGGFLTGDYVKFNDGWDKSDWFKSLPEEFKNKLKSLAESDLHLRVSSIKTKRPSIQQGNVEFSGTEFDVDITQETAPGLYIEFLTVPSHVLKHISHYPNLAPTPESQKCKTDVNIKPAECNEEPSNTQQKLSDDGKGKLIKGDRELKNKNEKIPAPGVESQIVGKSTHKYLPKKR